MCWTHIQKDNLGPQRRYHEDQNNVDEPLIELRSAAGLRDNSGA